MKNINKYIPFSLFIIFTLIFFWDNLAGNTFFWEDFAEYIYPVQTFAARESSLFSLPMWNPYSFHGMPFLADLQVGFFYPLNRILNLFVDSGGNLPVNILQMQIIFHFLIAQITFFLLARSWKISAGGAVIGAVSYAFSSLMIYHAIHPMMIYHLAWFPLILMFFAQGLNQKNIRKSIISGLILGFVMLSGHPQTTLYISLFLGMYFLWNLFSTRKEKENLKSSLINTAIKGGLPFVIAGGIFAVQMFPTSEMAEYSQRKEITYEMSSEGSLQWKQALALVSPELFGKVTGNPNEQNTWYLEFEEGRRMHYFWETGFYFGIASLTLGLISIVLFFTNREKNTSSKYILFLIIMTIFGFIFALGKNGFLFDIFFNLPLFGSFRNPARMMFVVIFAMSLLAGFGFDRIIKGGKEIFKPVLIIISIVLIVLIASVGGMFNTSLGMPENIVPLIMDGLTPKIFLSLIILVVIVFISKSNKPVTYSGFMIATFVFVDLFMMNSSFLSNPNNPADNYKLNPQMQVAFKSNPLKDFFRVNTRIYKPPFMAVSRNQGMVSSIMMAEGYNPLILKRPSVYLSSREKTHDIMAMKYELIIGENSQPSFVENTNRFPHAWTVRDFRVETTDNLRKLMESEDIDYHSTVILEEEAKLKYDKFIEINSEGKDKIKLISYNSNEYVYEITTKSNCIFINSEIFYHDWKAFDNGEEVDILRVNYALRGLELEAGTHRIEYRFESSALANGGIISIITLLGSILSLFLIGRNKKNN
jgi:hypothetical protein